MSNDNKGFTPQKGYVAPHGSQAAKEVERQRRATEQARATRQQEMTNMTRRGGSGGGSGGPAGCFPAETPIATPGGTMPIGEIETGTLVLAFDRQTGTIAPRRVIARHAYRRGRLWEITLDDAPARIVRTTKRHPFLTTRGWIQTHALRPGDRLRAADGRWTRVMSITVSSIETTVYNLITDGEHTYIANGVVVHNFAYLRGLRTAWYRLRAIATGGYVTAHRRHRWA